MVDGFRDAVLGVDDDSASSHPWSSLTPAEIVGVLDRLTDGIFVLGLDRRISYVNGPGAAMLGREASELSGRRLTEEFPEIVGHPFHLAAEDAIVTGETQRLVEYYAPLERWFEIRMFANDDKVVALMRDVTDRQRVEDELREHVHQISEAERIARFGVWEWEIATGRVRWSDELHRIYGLHPGEFGGSLDAFMERVHPDDRERVQRTIVESLKTLEPFVFDEHIVRPDGTERMLVSHGRVVTGPDGSAQALVGVCHDITERAQAQQALGASERRMRAVLDNSPSMITVKDLDGRYLMGNAEAARIVGRTPSELEGLQCTDLFGPEIATPQRAADRRAASEGEPVYTEARLLRDGELRTYMTVTFALPDDDGYPAETCTIATDVTERRERETERRERLERTEQIETALAEDRLVAFAQPIVSLATGAPTSSELLVRMRTPGERAEILLPDAFLPAAERYGLTQAIDVWMVRQALAMPDEGHASVNVSAVTMSDAAACREIVELLRASPDAARRVVFEITETANVEQLEAARAFAHEITSLGCRLALDDFGVGFGSLTYLRSLPLSYLKVDRSFVRHLVTSDHDRRLVRAVIGIAHEFGLETVIEGIEDEATLELLHELGADYAQGYHLGRPAPLSA